MLSATLASRAIRADPARYPPEIMEAYRRALDDPGAAEGMCEDYRAGATVDLALDDADRKAAQRIRCPVLALWAAHGGLPKVYPDILEVWRAWAADVRGEALDAKHFLAEDRPEQTATALLAFLTEQRPRAAPETGRTAPKRQSRP
jgi:haloacetate dehalogenase